jgi:hypothetical protein
MNKIKMAWRCKLSAKPFLLISTIVKALNTIPFVLKAAGVLGYAHSPQLHSLSMLMGTHSLAAFLHLQLL